MTKVMNSRRLRTVILRVKEGLCRGTASGAKRSLMRQIATRKLAVNSHLSAKLSPEVFSAMQTSVSSAV